MFVVDVVVVLALDKIFFSEKTSSFNSEHSMLLAQGQEKCNQVMLRMWWWYIFTSVRFFSVLFFSQDRMEKASGGEKYVETSARLGTTALDALLRCACSYDDDIQLKG